MEKPDWVSWEDVCECIRKANVVNDKQGFHMLFSKITPDEIKNRLKEGFCFVALHNNKVVGTASFRFLNLKSWYYCGRIIYTCYDAILPEYRGTDVYLGLGELRRNKIKDTGIRHQFFHTAEGNKTVLKINLRRGFKPVLFIPTGEGADYYTVVMAKWMDGCPYNDRFVKFMFNLSKVVTKSFLRPDGKFKYWFH